MNIQTRKPTVTPTVTNTHITILIYIQSSSSDLYMASTICRGIIILHLAITLQKQVTIKIEQKIIYGFKKHIGISLFLSANMKYGHPIEKLQTQFYSSWLVTSYQMIQKNQIETIYFRRAKLHCVYDNVDLKQYFHGQSILSKQQDCIMIVQWQEEQFIS
eukprot:EST42364.1 Hypothetical protein SS50377_18097 [Spironucleus salmonicida]